MLLGWLVPLGGGLFCIYRAAMFRPGDGRDGWDPMLYLGIASMCFYVAVPWFAVTLTLWLLYVYIGPRMHEGCCPECGYNLTGNVSGRCPECGTEIERGAVQ